MKQGRSKSEERALPHSYPTFYYDVRLGSEARRNSRTPRAESALLSPRFSCPKCRICPWPPRQPVAGHVPSRPPSQATTDNGQTHSDQLIMLPITSSTMRSWREAETRGLREEKRDREKSGRRPKSAGPPLPRAPPTSRQREESRRRRRAGGPGRYHVERPAALADAICVEHVEDAAADARVCKKGKCSRARAPLFPGHPGPRHVRGPQAFRGHSHANPHQIPHSVILPGPPARGQNPMSAVNPGP